MLASLLYGPFLSPAAGDASRRKAEQQGQDGTHGEPHAPVVVAIN